MRSTDFLQLLQRQPFQAFRLHLTTGQTYEVRHPELALVQRSLIELQLLTATSPIPLADREVIIVLLHIVWIEFLEIPSALSNN